MTARTLLAGLFMACAAMAWSAAWAGESIVVRGLFQGAALLEINGLRKLVREGQTHPGGARLLSASAREAVVEWQGERHTLTLNRSVGANYRDQTGEPVVLHRNRNNEYRSTIYVNNRAVDAVVDTGANVVALSSLDAKRLGIEYRQGQPTRVATASGTGSGYRITLDTVRLGTITHRHVPAVVIDGDFPHLVLLGMTFLEHVDLEERGSVLTLTPQF